MAHRCSDNQGPTLSQYFTIIASHGIICSRSLCDIGKYYDNGHHTYIRIDINSDSLVD